MALVITVAIGKGGVGKTATTVNLAARMALDGKKVLVVDTDLQANSTFFLTQSKLKENKFTNKGLFDMLRAFGILETGRYISQTAFSNIDIIPSNANTPLIPSQLTTLASSSGEKETDFLLMALAQVADDYDYILIDTPPAHDNVIVQSALLASDYVIIPVMYEEQCMDSLEATFAVIRKLEKQEDSQIKILGILPTIVERTALTAYYKQVLNESAYGQFMFSTEIRKGNAVKESGNGAKPVIFYAKSSNPAKDYMKLYSEVAQKIAADEGEN